MDISKPIPTLYGYFHEKFMPLWNEQVLKMKEQQPQCIERVEMPIESKVDMPTLWIRKEFAHEFLKTLKDEFHYSFLTDFTATDEQGDEIDGARFVLVFHLMNPESKIRIRMKVRIQENETIQTFSAIWPGTNWAEREIFDMFGIRFEGHPDLRRILMDERWEGHPLRKDYPLKGYQVFLTPEPLNPERLK